MPDRTPSHQTRKFGAVPQLAPSSEKRPGPLKEPGLFLAQVVCQAFAVLWLRCRGHRYLMSWIAIDVEPRVIGWPGTIGPDDT